MSLPEPNSARSPSMYVTAFDGSIASGECTQVGMGAHRNSEVGRYGTKGSRAHLQKEIATGAKIRHRLRSQLLVIADERRVVDPAEQEQSHPGLRWGRACRRDRRFLGRVRLLRPCECARV